MTTVAYDRQSILLSWLFEITGSDESAVTSLHITGDPGFGALSFFNQINDGELDSATAAFKTMLSTPELRNASYAHLLGLKVAPLGVDGKYLTDGPKFRPVTSSYGGYQNVIPQATVVLSLHSNVSRGRANRGRMFLPYTELEFNGINFGALPQTTEAVAVQAALFIDNINSIFNDSTPGVDSPTVQIMSKLGSGTTREVTRVGVGRITDTQQRRRRQLSEDEKYVTIG